MHVTVHRYVGLGSLIDRLVPLVRAKLVPSLRAAPGFLGHCTYVSEDGHLIILTVSRDRSSAVQADKQVQRRMSAALGDMARPRIDITAGEALLHEVASVQRGDEPPMFIIVRVYDGIGPREEVLPRVREHVFLTITGAAGFRGYYAYIDEKHETRGVAVSLFDNREHALEANERTVSVMRDQHIAPGPPVILAGQTMVVASR
ncbi:hypothetical protein [Falsiroseomonas sp. HW251]|uniref:hypothetical protein n=1 Tax=Falsiroseomonas sp. HW251 TaxID=3390998 RepID=UPI003D318498